jgi:teichuronic acid biosynthesis glycosyltransferase TuaC
MGGNGDGMIRTLTYSTFFPNAVRPLHGIATAERLRHLLASGRVRTRIVAPVPWFPLERSRVFARYSKFARVARVERWQDEDVLHPRYPVIPKVGTSAAPALMAMATSSTVARLDREAGGFDVIDAQCLYPDGVAGVMLGRRLNRPVVITARGSDVNVNRHLAIPRRLILWAVKNSAATITVSGALKQALVESGADPARITVLRNGVDLERFRVLDRGSIRARLGLSGSVLLSVGNLLELKGHHLAIEALARLPATTLLIAGDGPMRQQLEECARTFGVTERVRFLGPVPNTQLRDYYNAADLLVLASSREGMANVLLESLACGTPCVTTAVGGSPEIIADSAAGTLMRERSADALVAAIQGLFEAMPDRAATRRYAEQLGWAPTTEGQIEIFARACHRPAQPLENRLVT